MTNKFRTRCGSSSSQRRSCAVFPLPDEFVPLKRAICYRATLSFLLLARQEGGKAVESGWEDTAQSIYRQRVKNRAVFFFLLRLLPYLFSLLLASLFLFIPLDLFIFFRPLKFNMTVHLPFKTLCCLLCVCVLYVLQF